MLTDLASSEVNDEVYNEVSRYFNEQELHYLTLCIVAINGLWAVCVFESLASSLKKFE